jgi:hypothetical protein
MIQLYDEALADYLKAAFEGSVSIVPVSEYWQVIAMHKEGQLQLPAICISRATGTGDPELQSWVIGKKGRADRVRDHKLVYEQALPLSLRYNLTVLTTTQDDSDELTSEVIFLILNKPRVLVKIPYGSERDTHGQIMVSGELTDGSLRDSFSATGILYQSIIPVKMLGANIFNLEKRNLRFLQWDVGANPQTKEE